MKQYFAKYLPVEGEIKEGDLISGPTGLVYATPLEYTSAFKKVKLFLCSRDIQVGDKIKSTQDERVLTVNKIKINDRHTIYYDKNKHWFSELEAFKVIGEISPDATWVNEGDEFEFKDLSPYTQACIEHKQVMDIPVSIKGTCGYYH
jgi:hypothetical protein